MFVSKDPTVGSLSNLPRVSGGFSPLSCVESALPADGVRSGPFHRHDQSIGSKCPYVKILPLDCAQIFSLVFGGCFPWSCVESALPAYGVRSGPFHRQDQSTGSKSLSLKIRPLDRAQIFTRVFGGCFTWSFVDFVLHADGVRSQPFHRKD